MIPGTRTFSFARILLGLTLLVAPVPLGAVNTWAWASITILTLLVVILWMVGSIQEGKLRTGFSPVVYPDHFVPGSGIHADVLSSDT